MENRQLTYTEPLEASELLFLINKVNDEQKQYLKIYGILVIMSFVFPLAGSWYRETDYSELQFSGFRFICSTAVLLFISTFSTYSTYRVFLRKIKLDVRRKTKTIEGQKIIRKLFVPLNKTYHFYLDSQIKMSIEVSAQFYNQLNEGDEVNIEYSTYSKEYFGYF